MKTYLKDSLNILLCFDVTKAENDSFLYAFSLYAAENDHFPCYICKCSLIFDNMNKFENYCLERVLSYFGTARENYKTIHWQN